MQNKNIISVFIITAAILLIPLVAMQFSSEWNWNLFDFIVIGILVSGTGLLMVFAARKIKSTGRRVVIISALLALCLLTWVHLAVGIIDSAPFAGS